MYVMIWMWSRPPPPLGTALSATRLVAALLVAMVSCPALALFFGAVGVLIGAVVVGLRRVEAKLSPNRSTVNSDTYLRCNYFEIVKSSRTIL